MMVPGIPPVPSATAPALSPERNRHEPQFPAGPARVAGLPGIPAWRWRMSGTISSDRRTGPDVTGRRGGRRWVVAGVVIVIVAAGVGVAAATGAFKGSGSSGPGAAGTAYLTSQGSLSGTLADSGSYTIVNQATGTITTLPPAGKTVRQGGVLYQVSGTPVGLLYG